MEKNIKYVKIGISIVLFLAFADVVNEYGYYEFVRFVSFFGFMFIAWQNWEVNKDKKHISYLFAVLSILFNPFIKFHFGRELWKPIDLLVAIGLLLSLINWESKEQGKQDKVEENQD